MTRKRLRTEGDFLAYDDLRSSLLFSNETDYDRQSGSSVVRVRQHASANGEDDTVRLIHLSCAIGLSTRGGSASGALLTSAKAAMMAAFDFNERRETIVPGLRELLTDEDGKECDIRMTLDFYDTERTAVRGAAVLSEHIHRRGFPYEPTAVVGAVRSAVSIPMAILNSMRGIPQISYASTSSVLDNRESYPFFGRVIPSTTGDAEAAMDYLVNVVGTKHLGIVYVNDSYGTSYQVSLEEAASRAGVKTLSIAIDWFGRERNDDLDAKMQVIVDRLAQGGYRHFVGAIFGTHLTSLVPLGQKAGIVGPGNFWLFGDGSPAGAALWSSEQSAEVFGYHGMAFIAVGTSLREGHYDRFLSQHLEFDDNDAFREYYASKSPLETEVTFVKNQTFPLPSHFPPVMYDTVMAMGIAACNANSQFFDGAELFDSFLDSDFTGASGRVAMDPKTGSRLFNSSSYVVQATRAVVNRQGGMDLEAYTAAESVVRTSPDGTQTMEWIPPDGATFNYSDFTQYPPPSLPPLEQDYNTVSAGVRVVAVAASLLLALTAIYFAVWTFRHRRSHVVRASQPGFLLVVCAGCFLMFVSAIPVSSDSPPLSEDVADLSCMIGYWPYSLGFSLAFGALFAKTWRINRILGAENRFRRVVVSAKDVILPSVALLCCNVIVLVTWQAVAPYRFERVFDIDESVDKYGRPNSSQGSCVSDNGLAGIFLLLIFLLNGTAIIAANVQVYRARHITTEFSESRYIAIAMGIVLQFLVIALPAFFYETPAELDHAVRTVLILLCSGSILFLIFIPKIGFHRKHERQKAERARCRASRVVWNSGRLPPSNECDEELFDSDDSEEVHELRTGVVSGDCAPTEGFVEIDKEVNGEKVGVLEVMTDTSNKIPRRHFTDCSSGIRMSSSVKSSNSFGHSGSLSIRDAPDDSEHISKLAVPTDQAREAGDDHAEGPAPEALCVGETHDSIKRDENYESNEIYQN